MWDLSSAAQPLPGFNWTSWMADLDHPSSRGHKYMADMVIVYMQGVVRGLQTLPLTPDDELMAVAELPSPMYKVHVIR